MSCAFMNKHGLIDRSMLPEHVGERFGEMIDGHAKKLATLRDELSDELRRMGPANQATAKKRRDAGTRRLKKIADATGPFRGTLEHEIEEAPDSASAQLARTALSFINFNRATIAESIRLATGARDG